MIEFYKKKLELYRKKHKQALAENDLKAAKKYLQEFENYSEFVKGKV